MLILLTNAYLLYRYYFCHPSSLLFFLLFSFRASLLMEISSLCIYNYQSSYSNQTDINYVLKVWYDMLCIRRLLIILLRAWWLMCFRRSPFLKNGSIVLTYYLIFDVDESGHWWHFTVILNHLNFHYLEITKEANLSPCHFFNLILYLISALSLTGCYKSAIDSFLSNKLL